MKTQLLSPCLFIFISLFLIAADNSPAASQQAIFKIGTEFTQLTTHPDSDLSPRISPDGKWMAFVSNQSGNYDVYIKNLKTGRSRQMTTHQADDFYPVWDKKSRYLIFVSQRSDAKGDLFRLNLRNVRGELIGKGEPERLTNYMGFDGFPSISEYDEHIAWVSDRTGRPEIWFMTKKSQNVRQLTHGGATHPAWSPKQPYIAFTSFRQDSSHGDIWIINLYAARELVETKSRTDSLERPMWPVTKGVAADGFPTWSPDANTILFTRSDFDDNRDGVISPSDKSVLWAVDVSHLPAEHQSPPNPSYLMYRNSFDERIAHAARPLVSAAYDPRQPEFGSDGCIYFVSEIKGNSDIYQVKAADLFTQTGKADSTFILPEPLPDQLDSHDIYRLFTESRPQELSIDQQRILWQRIQSFQNRADVDPDSAQHISSSLYEIAVTFFSLGYIDQARKFFDILLLHYSDSRENSAYAELFKLSLDQLSTQSNATDEIGILFQNLEFVRTQYAQDSLFVARSRLLEGDLYVAGHQEDRAERLFQEIPILYPTQSSICAAALLKLASLQKLQGRFMDSFQSYSQLLQQYYDDTALIQQVQEGILDLFTSGLRDDDELLTRYKAIIRYFSAFDYLIVEPFFKIAEIYVRRLDYDAALETLDYIQSHFHHLPDENFKAQMMYADILLKKGELLQATNSLGNTSASYRSLRTDLMQKADERFTDILYQSARELFSTQNYPLAASRFQRVLQVNPHHIPSHQGYINSRYLMGEIDQVITEYNQALADHPDDNIRLYALGLAYSYKGAERNLQNYQTTVVDAHALLQSNEILHKALSFDYSFIEAYLTLSFNYELLENDQHLKAALPKSFWRKAGGTLSAPIVWLYHTLTFYEETKPPRYYEMAIQELTRALALNDERQNPDWEALLALNMANNYYNLGEFGFRKAYEFYHISLVNDSSFAASEEEVLIKEKMGHCSLFVNDQENGPRYLKRTIELYRKSNNELRVLLNIKRLALLYEIGENSSKALDYYKQAAEIEKRRELWDGLMRSYRSIAFHHFQLNQRRLSAQYANEALQLLESGQVLRKKSNPIYLQIGFFDLYFPFPYDLRKVGAKSTIELSTEEEEAFIYTILAQAFQDDKMFDEAISFYQKKFQIYELRHDIDAQAVFQNNMGYLYFLKGDYDNAWRMFTNSYWWCVKTKYISGQILNLENAAQVVLTISKEENPSVRQNLAKYQNWISGKLLEMLKFTAEDEALYAAQHAHYYLLLADLAVVAAETPTMDSPADVEQGYLLLQQAAQADEYLKQAAQLADTHGLSPELCAITFRRAENHLRFGDQSSALVDFIQARNLALQFKLRQLQWQIDTSLGKLLQNTTLKVQENVLLPSKEPSFYFQEAIRILESDHELPSGLTATRKRSMVQEPYRLLIEGLISQNRVPEALQTAERMREKAFIDILEKYNLRLLSIEQQTLWNRTDSLQTEIKRLEFSLQSAKNPKVQQTQTMKLEELQEQYALMLEEIRSRAPELEHLIHISSIPINKIQATLHDNEAILYQLVSDMECRLWLITSQTINFVDIPIRKADLNAAMQKWMIEGKKDTTDIEFMTKILSRLSLQEFQHVTFIPDFDLFSFPWSTLFEQCSYPQIETIASSLTSYSLCVKNQRAVGHRIYISAGALADSIKQIAEFQVTTPALPSHEMNEEQLPQELSEANIIHLEGKADWNITFPSYAKLTPDDINIPSLNPSSFYAEKTNASLIIFNSKNIKLNEQQVEPLIAWERSFLYNGASAVLVSLWPTDDSSHVFYRHFYANLLTRPPAQALRQTRLELQQQSLPFKWYGGYQLYGFYGYAGEEEEQNLTTVPENIFIQAEEAFRRGQWAKAINYDLQALTIASPTSAVAAETENHLFTSAVNGGNWQTVVTLLKNRIDTFSKRKEWQSVAEAMVQLYVVYLQLQQNSTADALLQQYRQTCRAYGLEFNDAAAFVQLGAYLQEGASNRAAVAFFLQAAERYRRLKNPQKQIECLVYAGSILAEELHDISGAQDCLQEALTIAQADRFIDWQISILLKMSRAQLMIENYSSAQIRLDQVVKLASETKTALKSEYQLLSTEISVRKGDFAAANNALQLLYPTTSLLIDDRINTLLLHSQVQALKNDLPLAQLSAHQALELAMLSGKSSLESKAVQQLGILLWMAGNITEAMSYMETALQNERGSRGNYSSLQNRLAVCSCYIDAGRLSQAYQTALDILRDCRFFHFNEFIPQCYILLSKASSDKVESTALADSAYYWANFYYQWPTMSQANHLLAVQYDKSGRFNEALKKYRQGLSLLTKIQPKPAFRWYAEGLALSLPGFFDDFIDFLIRHGQADEAMIIADQYNSLQQHQTLQMNATRFKSSDQLPIDRYNRLKENLNILKRDWISQFSSPQRTVAIADTQAIKKSFALTIDSLFTFQTELASQNQNLYQFYFQNYASPEKIQKAISDEECCISYCYTDKVLFSWYMDHDSIFVHQSAFNSSLFAEQIGELYQELEARESIATISHQFYQDLISPWASKLTAKKRLKIIPFEKLYLLPFALLQNENDEFLGFQNILSVHSSLSLAVRETANEKEMNPVAPKRAYAFAKPLSSQIQSDLSNTPRLATSLGRYIVEPIIYLDSRATESKLKSSASAMDFLFLGAEIVFDGEYAPNTRILLTKDEWDDGELSLNELITLNQLPKDVCLTNVHKQDPLRCSGVAVQLFSSLFHYQGTGSLLFPLFSDDSFESSLLLKRYFRALAEGDGSALALQKAQQYIYQTINPHPASWASFISSNAAN